PSIRPCPAGSAQTDRLEPAHGTRNEVSRADENARRAMEGPRFAEAPPDVRFRRTEKEGVLGDRGGPERARSRVRRRLPGAQGAERRNPTGLRQSLASSGGGWRLGVAQFQA